MSREEGGCFHPEKHEGEEEEKTWSSLIHVAAY